ncbi:hypothetical protein GCM10009087_17400 [Sphingomonas oligophenolica]|uniref:Serine kinase n=1 Tax=Sphingomonas oligophenolica TaxID=301154 RepID=A0ABU9Y5P1_9SPHN
MKVPPIARHYLAYDLVVRSELALPGGIVLGDGDPRIAAGVDIEIAEGDAALHGPTRDLGPYRLAGDSLLFEMPRIARYRCDAGMRIIVERIGDTPEGVAASYLIATALPALLWMRGEVVLHAAAAVLPGAAGAIAVGGTSGSGKSTILRALVAAGASVVADDSLCLRFNGAGMTVSGLAGGYFVTGGDDDMARRFETVPADRRLASTRLAGLMMLGARASSGGPALHVLGGVAALEALLASRHRPRIPTLLGNNKALLPVLARLSETLPIHLWNRREGVAGLDPAEMAWLTARG